MVISLIYQEKETTYDANANLSACWFDCKGSNLQFLKPVLQLVSIQVTIII